MATAHPIPVRKPALRGWLHAGFTPIALTLGLILVALAPSPQARLGGAVWTAGAALLFGTSALYHRGRWSPRVAIILRRLDHANIFVFIASTYTPLALLLLDEAQALFLLALIWTVGAAGMVFNLSWLDAPRWLYTVLYLLMGWAAVGWLVPFWVNGGPLVVLLIGLGGLFYSVGAVIYARKRPDPAPSVFGFHEIFHACTIAAALCHYAAIAVATFN